MQLAYIEQFSFCWFDSVNLFLHLFSVCIAFFHIIPCFIISLHTPKKTKSIKATYPWWKVHQVIFVWSNLGILPYDWSWWRCQNLRMYREWWRWWQKSSSCTIWKIRWKFLIVVLYMPIMETGQVRFPSYVGIGFVFNISGSDRRSLFTGYHPLSIVDFFFYGPPQNIKTRLYW